LRILPPKHAGLLMQLLPVQVGLFEGQTHDLLCALKTRPPEQMLIFGMQITPVHVGALAGQTQMILPPTYLLVLPPVH
jgi:hypothetical protein